MLPPFQVLAKVGNISREVILFGPPDTGYRDIGSINHFIAT